MAGRGHHYLPKFLQKGFASDDTANTVRTWVYRKDSPFPTKPTNITNVGKVRDFYGKLGEPNADPNITELEGVYAPIVDRLRTLPDGSTVAEQFVPEIVTNLTLRAASLRKSMLEVMSQALDAGVGNPTEWELKMDAELRKRFPHVAHEEIRRKRAALAPKAAAQVEATVVASIDELRRKIREAHNTALSTDPSSTALARECNGQVLDDIKSYRRRLLRGHGSPRGRRRRGKKGSKNKR